MSSKVVRVIRDNIGEDEIPDGHEVLRVIFGKDGPIVLLTNKAEHLLRGEKAQEMRAIIEDSIKAVLDKIIVQ